MIIIRVFKGLLPSFPYQYSSLCYFSIYCESSMVKVWRRFTTELSVELQLLSENWKFILLGLVFQVLKTSICSFSHLQVQSFTKFPSLNYLQYIHGLAARGVHYLHRPGPILRDIGFSILPVIIF